MSERAVDGLRAERDAILAVAKSLTEDEWNAPSACAGWCVRDVVAHMGAVFHGAIDPTLMPDTTGGTEAAMEGPVAERRQWTIEEVVAEYETFSGQVVDLAAAAQQPPLADTMMPLGDLGTHPLSALAGCFCFDAYCHLRNDILAPLGPIDRPEPPRDEQRLAPTVEWMLAGLPWMSARTLAFLDRPVTLTLTGPGGGSWTLAPGGEDGRVRVTPGTAPAAAATITGSDHDFVLWASKRADARDHVTITGDEEYGARVAVAMHVF
ncbi:MAG: maleylpyruvate isomerase family mycothiol-dependent enzyme [Actinomycetota bacterium]